MICPYCGQEQPAGPQCRVCGGLQEALSLQASQNEMGPWFIRDPRRPFRPGCSLATLRRLIHKGTVTHETILRGPTTQQFWKRACETPGIAQLLGVCHVCSAAVDVAAVECESCRAPLGVVDERDRLGLAPLRDLEAVADSAELTGHLARSLAAENGQDGETDQFRELVEARRRLVALGPRSVRAERAPRRESEAAPPPPSPVAAAPAPESPVAEEAPEDVEGRLRRLRLWVAVLATSTVLLAALWVVTYGLSLM